MNAIGERVNEGRVLNNESRLEILQRHDAQVEEESKAKEARRVDKSRRRRDEFSVSLKCFTLGIIDWNPDSKEYIGRTFVDVAIGEEDEYEHGKVVDVVKSNSFNGVYFQYYNHKRCPAQPTKDAMEQTACKEFSPWKRRGSDFVWDPKN